MKIMKIKSIIPLATLAVGVFWIIYGLTKHGFWHPVRGPISGFLPVLVAIPLVPVSIVGFIQSLKQEVKPNPLESMTIVLAAVLVFCLTFIFGMIITLMIFTFVWVKIYEKSSWKHTIISLAIAFFLIYGIFGTWLQVPFPYGLVIEKILG